MPSQSASRSRRKVSDHAAAEYALLGTIARTDGGQIHGYDLARVFAESALGKIVRIEPDMLYHYLKKLARNGLVTTRVEHQAARPDRQVHTLTPAGAEALRAWIMSPVTSTREIRLDFLVKLYLLKRLDTERAEALVDDQRQVMQSRAVSLQVQVDDAQSDDPDNAFGDMVLRLRLGQTRAAIDWLDSIA